MTLPRVRKDALPEETEYRDDGCSYHPHCLSCPLTVCRYDDPHLLIAMRIQEQRQKAVRLRAEGLTVNDVAARLNISRRTVFRLAHCTTREGD